MKTFISLILGLMISGLIYSQDYYPLVQENNEWNVLMVIGYPYDTTYWTITYNIYGDTTISGQNYKKVYKSGEYEGGIREEEQKVWYFSKYYDEETQIYDFTLEVGDTMNIYYDWMVVDSISSIEINGEDRKHMYFSCYGQGGLLEHWIEGIGSNFGVLQSGGCFVVGYKTIFLCMSEDGELIYMNPNYSSCYFNNTEIVELHNPKIQVYPNPTKDKINIKKSENVKIETITIIDIIGKKLLEFDKDRNELDLSGLSSGIYLLKLTFGNDIIIKKIIID